MIVMLYDTIKVQERYGSNHCAPGRDCMAFFALSLTALAACMCGSSASSGIMSPGRPTPKRLTTALAASIPVTKAFSAREGVDRREGYGG